MFETIKRYWNTVGVIAVNTYKETVRDRILYSLIGFAALVIAASLLAGSVSLGQDVRVIESFSLTAMLVFLLIITLFVGTQSVFREVERKTAYLTLTKPVSRDQFYLGKYLGICLTIAVCAAIMGAIFLFVLYEKSHVFSTAGLWAIIFLLFEAWLLTAVGLLFSAFSSPIASAIYTLCLALIGHSSTTIWAIANKNTGFVKGMLEFVYYVFPNLEKFNLRNEVMYAVHPTVTQFSTTLLYFLTYTLLALILGILAFRHDEF